MTPRRLLAAAALLVPLAVSACGNPDVRPVADNEYNDYRTKGGDKGTLFGPNGLSLGIGGRSSPGEAANQGGALGVNAYLWRGTLDTLSFMPLASADPFGGVIITDWYTPPTVSGERFKATAYILGRTLRADGLRLSVFRQVLQDGQWVDAPVDPVTTSDIENKILVKARSLRAQATASG